MSRYFMSKAKIEAAANTSLIEYLRRRGYELKPNGSAKYLLLPHSSLIIDELKNKWYWNKTGDSGGAIDFLMFYEKMDFMTAVATLLDMNNISRLDSAARVKTVRHIDSAHTLPKANSDERRVFGYLCKARKIPSDIVHSLIAQGLIYEDTHHNAVFVRYINGKPMSCFMRGTNTEKLYKGEAEWSDKRYGFLISGTDKTVCVFEAAIDALSFAAMLYHSGVNWRRYNLLSLGGTAAHSLVQYITDYPATENIIICTDSDSAGEKSAEQIAKTFADTRFNVTRLRPPGGAKDYNESLQRGCLFEQPLNF